MDNSFQQFSDGFHGLSGVLLSADHEERREWVNTTCERLCELINGSKAMSDEPNYQKLARQMTALIPLEGEDYDQARRGLLSYACTVMPDLIARPHRETIRNGF